MVTHELGSAGAGARVMRTVLVVDLVESVRLIEQDEEGAVQRWRAFIDRVIAQVLPAHDGRLVKSLGDGMMLEFPRVLAALRAAFDIQFLSRDDNAELPPERKMWLRVGAHVSMVFADERDLYGHGVNLAARLATLAGPGEVVVSAEVCDLLTPQLDAEVEDLGECYLKHVQRPVRAYRVGPPGSRPAIEPLIGGGHDLHPTVAVIPFSSRTPDPEHDVLGDVLADEIINSLSRTSQMHVISRLSTTPFRGRSVSLDDICQSLHAGYVLTGSYQVTGRRVVLLAQLTEARQGRIVWSGDVKGIVSAVLNGDDPLVGRVVRGVSAAMMAQELARAQAQPLATLESYALLLGGIALMHRLSRDDFDRARDMLVALTERLPRQALPHAWLANWHVLRVQQGWTDDAAAETRIALAATRRALELDPDCTLALAIDGFVHTNLLKRLDVALSRYESALKINPNESIAWLLKGTLHAFRGEGSLAMRNTQRALRLSPLDPLRYFYDSLAATAAISAGHYDRALDLANRSLRANRTHASTLRARMVSQWQLGQHDEARQTLQELLRVDPHFTVERYIARSPSTGYETGRVWVDIFRQIGVPER
jgi:class 3 adenylate cyclase/tetratricopeptide (TPR) repeat protein